MNITEQYAKSFRLRTSKPSPRFAGFWPQSPAHNPFPLLQFQLTPLYPLCFDTDSKKARGGREIFDLALRVSRFVFRVSALVFSTTYALFGANLFCNSFPLSSFRTLCQKHPGIPLPSQRYFPISTFSLLGCRGLSCDILLRFSIPSFIFNSLPRFLAQPPGVYPNFRFPFSSFALS